MEVVAHRAGNDPVALRAAEGIADLIELDVHRDRGHRVEVRHAKRLWPTRRLWERWYLLPRDAVSPQLDEVLSAARSDTGLWFDLKGVSTNLTSRLLELAESGQRPIVVSSKSWWLLGRLTGTPNLRTFRSVGNRFELLLLFWLPTRVQTDGIVVHRRLLSPRILERLQHRGPVFTWNVTDHAMLADLSERGIAGVILDDLDLARP